MTRREEEIIQAAKIHGEQTTFSELAKRAVGVDSAYGVGFIDGAVWADDNPRKGLIDIDKACEWLSVRFNEKGSLDPNDIEDLKKAMNYDEESYDD